jgi:chorismate lyase/3-hydroxybenzoate synthase
MLDSSVKLSPAASAFCLTFEAAPAPGPTGVACIQAPWLAGELCESLFPGAIELPEVGGVRLFQSRDALVGYARESVAPGEMATRTEALYRRILAACDGRHLYRIWNYVPQINAHTTAGENYQAFCVGRAHAFEKTLGAQFETHLPAASAVGCTGDRLDVAFVAGSSAPRHLENPAQVPAYRYPIEHGPRAPSFARATVARIGDSRVIFVSGTSAIKGHRTVAPGTLDAQIDCTLDNLQLISRQAGLGDHLGAGRMTQRHFKVYLRRPTDLAAVRARLEPALIQPSDLVTYLHSDICRIALNIEIEATLEA